MKSIQRAACLLLALFLTLSAVAQSAATADLRGKVKDPNGAVITSATVTIRNDARNFERTVQTNESGDYVLLSVPPGHYTLTVAAKGFAKSIAKDVVLTVGQTTTLAPATLFGVHE